LPVQNPAAKSLAGVLSLFLVWTCLWNFRREFQEIHYFRGFKLSKSSGAIDQARAELELAWQWYPRDVNTNYELANAYARLAQENMQAGIPSKADFWRKKSVWAYQESLDSNCGYDEIYFNLAAVQSQMSWFEDPFPPFTVERPDGKKVELSGPQIR